MDDRFGEEPRQILPRTLESGMSVLEVHGHVIRRNTNLAREIDACATSTSKFMYSRRPSLPLIRLLVQVWTAAGLWHATVIYSSGDVCDCCCRLLRGWPGGEVTCLLVQVWTAAGLWHTTVIYFSRDVCGCCCRLLRG